MVWKGGNHNMVEDRDSYYSWAPLVDSLLDAYESQGDFHTVIEVEKANETRKHVEMVVPLLTMEELAEQVDNSRTMLNRWYGEDCINQYHAYRHRMFQCATPMNRSQERALYGDIWPTLLQLRQSVTAAMGDSITTDTPVLLACSGGVDSVALLHYMYLEGFTNVGVFTMDHGLRPEAEEEVILVEWYALQFGMPCFTVTENVMEKTKDAGVSFEMMGRQLRYEHLREIADDKGYEYIVTAHHLDDQGETILAHILRGSGLEGLQGMKTLTEDVWRPCLTVPKQVLQDYAKWLQCFYGDDASNLDTMYDRNWIRQVLLPTCVERYPQTVHALCRLGALAQCDASYFEQEVTRLESDYVSYDEECIVLDKRGLMGEHDALVSRLWKRILGPYVRPEQLSQRVMDTLLSLVKGSKGKEFRFRQVQVLTSYDTIKIILCNDIEKK